MTWIGAVSIGTGGTMIIDDDGTNIRYYLDQKDGATNIGSPGVDYSININGGTIAGKFTWAAGGGTRLIAGPVAVGSNQVTSFAIASTGTQGFGSGGTVFGTINRSTTPNAPTPVTYSSVTDTSMRLAWTLAGNGGAALDQVLLRRSLTSDFASYVDIPLAANATSYTATGLTKNTRYYWRVFAHNTNGFSPPSGTTSQVTADVPAAPGTPAASSITAVSMRLTWTLPSDNGGLPLNGVKLRRARNSAFTTDVEDFDLSASATGLTVTDLIPDTTYYWRVFARNSAGYSPSSGIRTQATPATGAPGLDVTASATSSVARFTPPGGLSGVAQYDLERRPIGGGLVNQQSTSGTSITSTGLTAGTRYEYRARARWNGGSGYIYYSPWTDWSGTPAAPGSLTATGTGPDSVRLNWTTPSNGGLALNAIIVERSTSPSFTSVATTTLAANATSLAVTGLSPNTTYYWRVYARNEQGLSPAATTNWKTFPETAPGFSITRTDTSSTAVLTPPTGGSAPTKYTLERRVVGSSTISSTDSATSPIVYNGLEPDFRYEWRASAWYGSYQTPWSGWLSTPGAPTTPSVTELTPTSLKLSWSLSTSNGGRTPTAVRLRRSTDPSFETYTETVLAATATTATVTGLTASTTYYWRVVQTNAVGNSPPSGIRTQTTLPSTPPGLTVTAAVAGTTSSAVMTPPGGVSGVTKYTMQRRVVGSSSITTLESTTSPIASTGLQPGTRYEYRASAWFGSYQSPWTSWIALTQPNPNTDPGAYFDGNTPNSTSVTYTWTGTANNSTTVATAVTPTGWAVFERAAASCGGTGAVFRAVGGASGGTSARAVFFTDATNAGLQFGTSDQDANARAVVGEDAPYVGSIHVMLSKAQRLRAVIRWMTAGGTYISASTGDAVVVQPGVWTRLSTGVRVSPIGARRASVVVQDVTGTGHSLWLGGDWVQADAAMLTLQTLFPYFDGDDWRDNSQYDYSWVGTPHASESTRSPAVQRYVDPLADPNCPPPPQPPAAPTIQDDCIVPVGTWRRYWAQIPATEISDHLQMIPTIYVETASAAAQQVRVRIYENPNQVTPEDFDDSSWMSEQIVSFLPARTRLTLEGVDRRAYASVNGAPDIAADKLLYGTDGAPASWAMLGCGVAYLLSFDVPLDAPTGNVSVEIDLTRKVM
ncbi:minor tail protein [Microbacterium phage Rasputia]|nr:minor tail protein [Microbacterium phage Rasputia]